MKRKIKYLTTLLFAFCLLFSSTVFAEESNALTPIEIDQILKDVEPVEVSPGTYLRDNGEYSIYDIDVSRFEATSIPKTKMESVGTTIDDIFSTRSWDLSIDYLASFSAKYRSFFKCDFYRI